MKAPNSTELIKVGVLTCHSGSGHIRNIWGPNINPVDGRARKTGMIMTHVWDGEPEQAESFAERYGTEVVENYWDMVGKVDGVILSDHFETVLFKHLARPYLEAGVPIFINRPFAFNLADAREMLDLAAKYNTPVMTGSSFEYVKEVGIIRKQVESFEQIRGYMADNGTNEYAWHGVHGIFMTYACLGGGVTRVSHLNHDREDPNSIGVLTLEYAGRNGSKPFYGQLQPTGRQGWIRVYGDDTFVEQTLWWEGSQWDRDTFLWLPMLLRMQDMFENGNMPESYDSIYEKTRILLAGFKSHIEHHGAPVALSDIGDWKAPVLGSSRFESIEFA